MYAVITSGGKQERVAQGQRVRVEWLKFLRPERKFASLAALQAQIARDKKAAVAYFKKLAG